MNNQKKYNRIIGTDIKKELVIHPIYITVFTLALIYMKEILNLNIILTFLCSGIMVISGISSIGGIIGLKSCKHYLVYLPVESSEGTTHNTSLV